MEKHRYLGFFVDAGGLSVPYHAPPEGDYRIHFRAGVTPLYFPTDQNMGMTQNCLVLLTVYTVSGLRYRVSPC